MEARRPDGDRLVSGIHTSNEQELSSVTMLHPRRPRHRLETRPSRKDRKRVGAGVMTETDGADVAVVTSTSSTFLRPLHDGDFDRLRETWADPEAMRHMSVPPMSHEQAAVAFRNLLRPDPHVRNSHRFAIVRRSDGVVIGTVAVDEERHSSAYTHSMVTHPDSWGVGFASDAYHLLLQFAFDTLGARRVWAAAPVENEAAERLVLGAGLTQCGTVRGYMEREGQPWDCHIFSCLEPEWRAHVRERENGHAARSEHHDTPAANWRR